MTKRSLNTFMNAMTAHNFTMYPFSTCNRQDYANLRSVYCDAVFFPSLREKDVRREIGIVHNEMQGVYADPSSRYYYRLLDSLLGIKNSGGKPAEIAAITPNDVCAFHASWYHPSNARFVTYGSHPIEDTLSFLDAEVFSKFGPSTGEAAQQGLFNASSQPTETSLHAQKKNVMSFHWRCGPQSDKKESQRMSLVGALLTDGPSSPFHKALIASGVAPEYSPATGFVGNYSQTFFSLGISNSDSSRNEDASSIIVSQLERPEFSAKRVAGLKNSVELHLRKLSNNVGLTMMHRVLGAWINGMDPYVALDISSYVDVLDEFDEPMFRSLIEKHLLRAPDLKITMNDAAPVDNFAGPKVSMVNEPKLEGDLSCLPTISIRDVPRRIPDMSNITPISFDGHNNVFYNHQPTNDIVYVTQISSGFSDVPTELPLLCSVVGKLPTRNRTYAQLADEMDMHADSVSLGYFIDARDDTLKLQMGASALFKQWSRTQELQREIVQETVFDSDEAVHRLRQIIMSSAQAVRDSIPDDGHVLAKCYAAGQLGRWHLSAGERVGGISYIQHLQDLDHLVQDEACGLQHARKIAADLESLFNDMVEHQQPEDSQLLLTGDRQPSEWNLDLRKFERASNRRSQLKPRLEVVPSTDKTVFTSANLLVDFAAMVVPIELQNAFAHPDAMALQILARIWSTLYLHREIREGRGAYGASCGFAPLDGVLSMTTYRDPSGLDSINTFQQACGWLSSSTVSEKDVEEAKLEILSSWDAPVAPQVRGVAAWMRGITDEMRQSRRDALFQVTPSDVHRVAEVYVASAIATDRARYCIFGNAHSGQRAAQDGWSVRQLEF
jgi:Zn-dependent M16 (insulinase) family peptidase